MLGRRRFLASAMALLAWAATAAPASAISAASPAEFVRALGDEALAILSDKSLDKAARRAAYRRLLEEGFAIDTIARFVIGRYWRAATPEQREEYMRLFRDFVIATYGARLDGYAGETFEITGTQPIDAKDTLVLTQVQQPDGPPVRVDYRVRATDEGFKVIDVYVEGVSLLTTQRSEFAAVINREGIDGLLDILRERSAELQTARS